MTHDDRVTIAVGAVLNQFDAIGLEKVFKALGPVFS